MGTLITLHKLQMFRYYMFNSTLKLTQIFMKFTPVLFLKMDNASISCSVCIEELSTSGNIAKKTQYRNLMLTLGRDEFKEIQLMVGRFFY